MTEEQNRLQAQLDRTRRSLRVFTQHYEPWMDDWADDKQCPFYSRHTFGELREALQVLGGGK